MNKHSLLAKVLTVFLVAALLAACSSPLGVSHPAAALQVEAPKRPTAFVPNPGLGDAAILFRTLGAAGTLFFERSQVVFPLPGHAESGGWFDRLLGESQPEPGGTAKPAAVRLEFIGADPGTRVVGQEQLPGVVNYYLGGDPSQWKTAVPTFGALSYEGLYPGIDLVYNGGPGVLKGTFLVAPGADPGVIRWRYAGAPKVELSKGELWIGADELGKDPLLIERRPVAWQTAAGKRTAVDVHYIVYDDGSIGFGLGAYDSAQPLVIDPTLDYATYWGGIGCDGAWHIALDSSNNIYITGLSNSQGYPHLNSNCDQTQYFDAFVTKLDPSKTGASQHVYTTYIGGSSFEMVAGIGVDAAGNAYITGFTESTDLPTTANAYQKTFGGGYSDGMAAQLNAAGAIAYLTYLGGDGFEELQMMTVADGLLYAAGMTDSSNFPITAATAYSSALQDEDATVSVLDTTKSGAASLVYSTFYGGSGADEGYQIAVANGAIYLAGATSSTDLPLKNPVQTTFGGGGWGDVFVAVLDRSQTGSDQLLFATYLGGSGDDLPGGIVPYGPEHVYVVGITPSSNFPTTAVSPAFGGAQDGFLTKLDVVAPTSIVYSRFVGGNGKDGLRGIAVDSQGSTYVSGNTGSSDQPIVSPLQAAFQGGEAVNTDTWWFTSRGATDGLVAKFDPNGTMTFGTFLGGSGADGMAGIRLGTDGKVYVAGVTRSTGPGTANAYQNANAGEYDAYIAAIGGLAPAPPRGLYLPLIVR